MRIATIATTICLMLLGPIAAAQTVTSDDDRAANLWSYRTYAWTSGTELRGEFNHARIVNGVDAAFAGQGLTRVEPSANPDMLVAYHASVDEDLEVVRSAHGMDAWVATLVVEITDASRGAIVWRGVASSEIRLTDSPDTRDNKIAKAMKKMFKNYPPKR